MMGYMRHHAIVVSTYDEDRATAAHAEATRIFGGEQISPIMLSPINGYYTFFVGPDGSKEGWGDSDTGDAARQALIVWLDNKRYGDGSGPFSWAEIQYGDENYETLIVAHSDEQKRQVAGCLA